MICKTKGCKKQGWHDGYCQKCRNRLVRNAIKMINTTRTREKGQKALHVKESVNMGY